MRALNLTQKCVVELLDYDPATGVFTWRHRAGAHKSWNTKYAGKRADSINDTGYRRIGIDRIVYAASHVAWLYVYGQHVPIGMEIDHRDGNRADDRIDNLRIATQQQNAANQCGWLGRSLPKGVKLRPYGFQARIQVNRKAITIGTFKTAEAAHEAYLAAARFHFAEFARAA